MKNNIKMSNDGSIGTDLKADLSFSTEDFTASATLSSRKFRCPKCGYEGGEHINVMMPGFDGKYCLNCYAKWISETFPLLESIQDSGKESK